jgi:hypothetical protein
VRTVLDLERLDVQIVEPEQRERILHSKAQDERLQEIGRALQRRDVLRLRACSHLDVARVRVHADLQLEVLHDRRHQLRPVLLERRVPVTRHGDLAHLIQATLLHTHTSTRTA